MMNHVEALHRLQEGNRRFAAEVSQFPRLDREHRLEMLTEGQNPIATVLACSDSRVPVEHIFDQGMGDLFVLRVAGNICGTTQIGTIEFAIQKLKTPLIIVLGHDDCGAVKAVVEGHEATSHLKRLLGMVEPAVDMVRNEQPDISYEDLLRRSIAANVFQSIEALLTGSVHARHAVRTESTRILGAVFDIGSGKVTWLGDHPDQSDLVKRHRGLRLRSRTRNNELGDF